MRKMSKKLKKLRKKQAERSLLMKDMEAGMHDVGFRSNFTTKDCHLGMIQVFTYHKAQVYAGARSDAFYGPGGYDLHIDLAGGSLYYGPKVKVNSLARELVGTKLFARQDVPVITIDWTDFGIPYFLDEDDWLDLAQAIGKIEGRVAIYCVGGHGRTGTALAILAALCGQVPLDTCPAEWVRHSYCEEAIESRAQLDYIQKMTGFNVISKPRPTDKIWYGKDWDTGSRGPYESAKADMATATTVATVVTGMPPATQLTATEGNIIPAKGIYRGEIAGYEWDSSSRLYRPKRGVNGHTVQDELFPAPILNAAGDIIGWDHTERKDADAERFGDPHGEDRPWDSWGS